MKWSDILLLFYMGIFFWFRCVCVWFLMSLLHVVRTRSLEEKCTIRLSLKWVVLKLSCLILNAWQPWNGVQQTRLVSMIQRGFPGRSSNNNAYFFRHWDANRAGTIKFTACFLSMCENKATWETGGWGRSAKWWIGRSSGEMKETEET